RHVTHWGYAVPADNNQSEPSVIVRVEENRAPFHIGKRSERDSGFIRKIGKIPYAVVPEKIAVFVGKIRDVQRGKSIVEVVADRDAHGSLLRTVFTHRRSGLQSNLLKFP